MRSCGPETGLLKLRTELGVYANLRPVAVHPALADSTTLKAEVVRGVDLVFVRELTGGIYFGAKTRTRHRCQRPVQLQRRGSRTRDARGRPPGAGAPPQAHLHRQVQCARYLAAVARSGDARDEERVPDVAVEHILVDAAAMHLIRRPADFDVIVTENMFGDILTDEASMLAGSLGLSPSASLGDGKRGLYEPIHGSAPDIAGKGIANPVGTILSAALLLRHLAGAETEAQAIERAVATALDQGLRTADIAAGGKALSTAEAGAAITALHQLPQLDAALGRHLAGCPHACAILAFHGGLNARAQQHARRVAGSMRPHAIAHWACSVQPLPSSSVAGGAPGPGLRGSGRPRWSTTPAATSRRARAAPR